MSGRVTSDVVGLVMGVVAVGVVVGLVWVVVIVLTCAVLVAAGCAATQP